MKFSKSGFTKHRIQSNLLEDATGETAAWNNGKNVWCKLDNESALVKRNISGLRLHYVWVLSENLKKLCLVPLENMTVSTALTEVVNKKSMKMTLDGEQLNAALTKVKREATRLIEMKKHQAVIAFGQEKKVEGWAYFTYRHNPIKIKMGGKTVMMLNREDRFKIKRLGPDKNILKIRKDPDNSYSIDDLKMSLLYNRSARWLDKHL